MSSQVLKSLHSLLITGMKLGSVLCDGTNTLITAEYEYPVPEMLKSENLDLLRILMQDPNMGDFISMRASAIGYQEIN